METSTPTPSAKKQISGDLVVIAISGLLAWGIYALGQSLADDIRALRTEGVAIEVEVVKNNGGSPPQVTVRYDVDGVAYTAHEKTGEPPPRAGSRVWGFYHPDNPDRVRLSDLDEDTIYKDMQPFRMLPILFLAPLMILIGARVARLRNKDPFAAVGPILGFIFLAIVVGVNFDEKVQAQIVSRFGEQIWGVPSFWVVSAFQILLLGPLLFAFSTAVIRLQGLSVANGTGIQRIGIIPWAIWNPVAKQLPKMRVQFLVSGALLLALLIGSVAWLSATS